MLAGTRPLRSFITYQVATCSSFAPVSASTALGALPFMPSLSSAHSSLSAKGTVRMWYYQSNNCSDSPNSGFEADVYVTQPDGTPYAGKPVFGYGFTGT